VSLDTGETLAERWTRVGRAASMIAASAELGSLPHSGLRQRPLVDYFRQQQLIFLSVPLHGLFRQCGQLPDQAFAYRERSNLARVLRGPTRHECRRALAKVAAWQFCRLFEQTERVVREVSRMLVEISAQHLEVEFAAGPRLIIRQASSFDRRAAHGLAQRHQPLDRLCRPTASSAKRRRAKPSPRR
jgi:hypothetical protein